MNKPKAITATLKAAALVGAFSLVATSASQAAFVGLPAPTPEVPGTLLGGLTATGGGTIVDSLSSPFSSAFNSGTLNTWVVDRDPGVGVALDFYYQVVNSAVVPPPDLVGAEVFRFKTTGGFFSGVDPVSVAQTDISPVTGLPVLGLQPARTADRDEGTPGSVGFEFPVAPGLVGDPLNLQVGETSTFMVVRTSSSTYVPVEGRISSADTGFARSFAAVPEPSSILFGLAMFGVALTSRAKNRSVKTA